MKRAYLATSYSYKTAPKALRNVSALAKLVQWWRFRRVTKAMARLLVETGWNVFSPITHSHPLPKYIPDRLDTHAFWLNLDFDWIDTCDELWVYMQPGWGESYGVKREIAYAKRHEKPVRYINVNGGFESELPRVYVLPKEVRE